jgi:hypothetical protein
MPISESAATSIRGYFVQIQTRLKACPLGEISPVRNLALALYEFNRGAHVSAIRPATIAPEAQLREDALENVRLLLESDLENAIDQEGEADALQAARELCRTLTDSASN